MCLTAISAIGCGESRPATYEVKGSVVFKDGTPLDHGSVEFQTEHSGKPITAIGEINSDGSFQLRTYKANDGALPGKHRVAVFSQPMIGTGAERPDAVPPPTLDPKYSDTKTSGLEFTVKEDSENSFKIEVERAE